MYDLTLQSEIRGRLLNTPNDFLPEMGLLVTCCRSWAGRADAGETVALLRERADWVNLLSLADRHRLMPLLARELTACRELVPSLILSQIQGRAESIATHNEFLTEKLLGLCDMFAGEKIRSVPVMGPILAARAYPSPDMRQSTALDFLVHPDDMPNAKALMRDQGYHAPSTSFAGTGSEPDTRSRGLISREQDHCVDLDSAGRLRRFSLTIPFDEIFDRLSPVQINGHALHTLCPADLLILLCVHGTKQFWRRLSTIVDIDALVRTNPNLDLAETIRQAEKLGARRMVELGLRLALDTMKMPMRPEALAYGEWEPMVIRLSLDIRRELAGGGDPAASQAAKIRFHLRARERVRDRLRYLFWLLALPLAHTGQGNPK